ncbi:acetolactate decarboxylase [Dyadobacter aurulentus]|uniref:acetolactate decarboxylase n=1 Tax=Dyadobacter sp. UC 10 TaxID=2605428 RepID=UPI0011F3392C|nr:acetolactate decarboxylase [Dyadobacter sp. UC 10]KAA0992791.1 acetolactate decarboxylase [Dyadobacter sp. UC 10]
MQITLTRRILSISFITILITFCAGCKSTRLTQKNIETSLADQDFMYQYSIIDALMAGVFDGDLNIAGLKTKGDFGVGTFNKVDGELMINNGRVYQVLHNGSVKEASDSDSTSAAFVKFFKADTIITITGENLSYEKIQEHLVDILNPNAIYALRITGKFSQMTTRAASPAKPPYKTLSEHLKTNQAVFELKETHGICNGFLLPPYLARTNVPGFHLHYVSDDLKSGGHIFKFTTNSVRVEIDQAKGFTIENNTDPAFQTVNLKPDRGEELKKIE